MSDFTTPILQWLNLNPELAGIATFIISAAESVAIIGTIVPGSVMMTAIGALVGAGIIPFWSTLFWAILGAIAGDGISYWFGHYFKDRLHKVWPFRTHPYLLDNGEAFFRKYGAMSVFIGRFVGPVRALVPLVAGMLGVKPLRFTIANVTSAILWAPAYMLPGFILGAASTELPSELAARIIFIILLIVLFIIFCIWVCKKIVDLIRMEINQFLTWVWESLKKSRYFYLITSILKHHDNRKTYGQLTLAFYLILASLIFLYLASEILVFGPYNIALNNFTFHVFRSLRSASTDNIMIFITLLGDKHVLLPLILTLTAWLSWTKHWRTALHVLALGIITVCSIEFFKYMIHSPRPWGVLGNSTDSYSFPSGHTTLACTFYFGITLLLAQIFDIKKRKLIYLATGTLVGIIAISRLYFGVHWLSDILGGILISTAILMLISLSYNRVAEKPIRATGIIVTVILTLMVSYTAVYFHSANRLKNKYEVLEWPLYTIALDSWWQQEGDHFPLYRVNRFGLSVSVFNVQWLGKQETITNDLLKNGWETPPNHDWLSALYRISAVQSTEHLPLVSPIYLDKQPDIVLIKYVNDNKKLIILRLWKSQFLIENINTPLWLGSIEYAPSTYSWILKRNKPNELVPTTSLLFDSTPNNIDYKIMTVEINPKNQPINQTIILLKSKKLSYKPKPRG